MFIADKHPLFYKETSMFKIATNPGQTRIRDIHTDKFKGVQISLCFIGDFKENNLNERALLPEILTGGNKRLKDRTMIQRELGSLYGAEIVTSTRKIGFQSVISFDLIFPSEKHLPGNPVIFPQALSLLKELVFQPDFGGCDYFKDLFKLEKRLLRESLENDYHDRFLYGYDCFRKRMFPKELFRFSARGELETIDNLTGESLVKAYHDMIDNDRIMIYSIGDFDRKYLNILEDLEKYGNNDSLLRPIDDEGTLPDIPTESEDLADVHQSRIYMGYRTKIVPGHPLYHALIVANVLLGDSDQSSLFLELREKRHLGYDVFSNYIGDKGVLFVFAAIEPGKEIEAKELAKRIVSGMKDREISEKDLEMAKEVIVKRIHQAADSPSSTVNRIFFYDLFYNKEYDMQSSIEDIRRVSKEDVRQAYSSLFLDTVYVNKRRGIL